MSRVVLHPDFERQLSRSPEMLAVLGKAAANIAKEARRIAPREAALPPGRRRHYADTISSAAGIDEHGEPVGRINAFHFTSLFIEFGTVHNPPYAPLRRALDGMRGRAL